jgi:hypothetical protein
MTQSGELGATEGTNGSVESCPNVTKPPLSSQDTPGRLLAKLSGFFVRSALASVIRAFFRPIIGFIWGAVIPVRVSGELRTIVVNQRAASMQAALQSLVLLPERVDFIGPINRHNQSWS